jgi:LDH2 family malate/lactate/ureidoglycolate dehydrogenase
MNANDHILQACQAYAWTVAVLCKSGLRDTDAACVANNLIDAELRAVCSHGLMLLPMYLERIRAGGIRADHAMRLLSDDDRIMVFDADGAPGQVALTKACGHLDASAQANGIALVNVVNNNHVGMLATYARLLAARGHISIVMTTAGPSVYPYGGQRPVMGNNAICVGAPTSGEPWLFDIATGIVACGKIRHLQLIGAAMDACWAEGADRLPTNDPAVLDQGGGVLPHGYKGFGWGCAVDVLAGLLDQAGRVGMDVTRQRLDAEQPTGCSQTVIAISTSRLRTAGFADGVARYLDRLRACEPQDATQPVLAPGDIELRHARLRPERGLPVPAALVRKFTEIGAAYGCAFDDYAGLSS